METAEVTDLYQASYYLLNGAKVLGVECIHTGAGTNCRIELSGTNLSTLADAWFDKKAVVNLWAFRIAYTEINSHIQKAKRSYDLSRRFHNGVVRGGRS